MSGRKTSGLERKLQGATASFGILNVLYIPNSVVTPVRQGVLIIRVTLRILGLRWGGIRSVTWNW
jgi:hypothetical protein